MMDERAGWEQQEASEREQWELEFAAWLQQHDRSLMALGLYGAKSDKFTEKRDT